MMTSSAAKKEQTSFLDDVTREVIAILIFVIIQNFTRLWNRMRGKDVSMSNNKIVKKLLELRDTKEGLPSGPDALDKAVDRICDGEFNTASEKKRITRVLETELKMQPKKKRKQDVKEMKRRKLEYQLKVMLLLVTCHVQMYSFSDFDKHLWYMNNAVRTYVTYITIGCYTRAGSGGRTSIPGDEDAPTTHCVTR